MSYDPPIPQNQYRPYGDFGPVCDSLVPSRALPAAVLDTTNECSVDADCPPGFVCVNGRCVPEDQEYETIWDPPDEIGGPSVKCKVRLREDFSLEFYDCKPDGWHDKYGTTPEQYNSECILIGGICYDWARDADIDLTLPEFDDFEVPTISRCAQFDTDINIRPQTFINNEGIKTTKYSIQGSTPVTFPVRGGYADGSSGSAVSCRFADDGNSIVVEGTKGGAVANIDLKLEWDDNPNTNGVFADSITVSNSIGDSVTFTRSGESGSETHTLDVPGEETSLSITYTNLNAANDPIIVEDGGRKLCLLDGDNTDCNGSFTIENVNSEEGGTAPSLWSADADEYAVWTNSAECTLPCQEQSVTYQIYFDETETYHFEFGADDSGEVYFDEEVTPFITATTPTMLNPSIFPTATGPTKVAKEITAGTHTLVVNCTNSFIQGVTNNTYYFGSVGASTGAATVIQLYSNFAPNTFQAPVGYSVTDLAFINQVGPVRWTDTNNDGVIDKNDDGVTADFAMTGGSGTGMVLNLTLRPLLGIDAGLQAARITLNDIVNRGTGYQVGDLLQIPGYPFDIPPVRVGQLIEDNWYSNFTSSNAVLIRTENSPGWTATSGNGNEVAGFNVPSDSPTGKYLGFGVVDEEGANNSLVTLRTCSFDMDLRNVHTLVFHIIAGNDFNGGEIPNNISESLRFSFDNSSWVKAGASKQFTGMNRKQYIDKMENWYEYRVTVPLANQVANQTLYFEQDISGSPEYMSGYNGLSDAAFTAAYRNGGDNYGIYRVDALGNGTQFSCSNISDESYVWAKNPGGWYVKICKYLPCRDTEDIVWHRVFSPGWSTFMNKYAIWVDPLDPGPFNTPFTTRFTIPLPHDGTLQLKYEADDNMTIKFDGTQVASITFNPNTAEQTTTFAGTKGNHTLEMTVTNVGNPSGDNNWSANPAGGAWTLSYIDGDSFNPFAFSLYTNSNNPESLPKDQFNMTSLNRWAYNNDGGATQLWYPPADAGGFDINEFSGYNELPGNDDYTSDGFIASNLNEWHYSDDGGSAQLWYAVNETVQDNYEMIGGSGTGMILKIELQGTAGGGGNPNNTRWRVKEVINPGTGYQAGDVLNFEFYTPRRNDLQLGPYSLTPDPIRLDQVGVGTGGSTTDFVEDEFDMLGGTGSNMRLKIRLEPHPGSNGGNNNTKYKIVEVINAGTGYSVNDELYFNFNTPRRISLGLGNTTFTTSGAQDYSVRLDAEPIKTSADLSSVASTAYWNTRKASGYRYTTDINDNVAQQ